MKIWSIVVQSASYIILILLPRGEIFRQDDKLLGVCQTLAHPITQSPVPAKTP